MRAKLLSGSRYLTLSDAIAGMAYLQVLTVFLRLDLADAPLREVDSLTSREGVTWGVYLNPGLDSQ